MAQSRQRFIDSQRFFRLLDTARNFAGFDLDRHLGAAPLGGDPLMNSLQTFTGMLKVHVIHLHANVLTARKQRCCAGASTSSEGIEYALSWEREAAD